MANPSGLSELVVGVLSLFAAIISVVYVTAFGSWPGQLYGAAAVCFLLLGVLLVTRSHQSPIEVPF